MMLGQREVRSATDVQEHVYLDARPPGNLLASKGRIHTPVSVLTMLRT